MSSQRLAQFRHRFPQLSDLLFNLGRCLGHGLDLFDASLSPVRFFAD